MVNMNKNIGNDLLTFAGVMGVVIATFYITATVSNIMNIRKLNMEIKNIQDKEDRDDINKNII